MITNDVIVKLSVNKAIFTYMCGSTLPLLRYEYSYKASCTIRYDTIR